MKTMQVKIKRDGETIAESNGVQLVKDNGESLVIKLDFAGDFSCHTSTIQIDQIPNGIEVTGLIPFSSFIIKPVTGNKIQIIQVQD